MVVGEGGRSLPVSAIASIGAAKASAAGGAPPAPSAPCFQARHIRALWADLLDTGRSHQLSALRKARERQAPGERRALSSSSQGSTTEVSCHDTVCEPLFAGRATLSHPAATRCSQRPLPGTPSTRSPACQHGEILQQQQSVLHWPLNSDLSERDQRERGTDQIYVT